MLIFLIIYLSKKNQISLNIIVTVCTCSDLQTAEVLFKKKMSKKNRQQPRCGRPMVAAAAEKTIKKDEELLAKNKMQVWGRANYVCNSHTKLSYSME